MTTVFQVSAVKSKLHSIDEFGIKNYKTRFVALLSILLMVLLVFTFGFITYKAEIGVDGATITRFSDALWLMIMSSTTIGFGDQYPVTFIGRSMVTLMFIFGVGIIGGLGALIASKLLGFSDTNVKNRELRKQNNEILQQNQKIYQKLELLEDKLDTLTNETK